MQTLHAKKASVLSTMNISTKNIQLPNASSLKAQIIAETTLGLSWREISELAEEEEEKEEKEEEKEEEGEGLFNGPQQQQAWINLKDMQSVQMDAQITNLQKELTALGGGEKGQLGKAGTLS